MLSVEQISAYYPPALKGFKRNMLREYLQYKILEAVYDSEFASKLTFLGGTAVRIVHGSDRFSEDLDFDNRNCSEKEFEALSEIVQIALQREGYEVTLKNVYRGAYRCYIRIPKALFESGLSSFEEETILIQLDTEPQNFEFSPEVFLLNKFDVFTQIQVVPVDLLLAQKLYASMNRKRAKGRDFYDIVLLSSKTKPNYDYLKTKMKIKDAGQLKQKLIEYCNTLDFQELAKDIEPFLVYPKDKKRVELFPEFVATALL